MSNDMSTPRKNTSMRRTRITIAAIFVILAAGIVVPPLLSPGQPTGTVDSAFATESVCDKAGFSDPDGGTCWQRSSYRLNVRDAHGDLRRVDVSESTFWVCWLAARYPACAQTGGGR